MVFKKIRTVFILFTDLTDLFHNHTFVGCVDQIRALVQHQVFFVVYVHTNVLYNCIVSKYVV